MTEDEFTALFSELRTTTLARARKVVGSDAADDVVGATFEVVWAKRASAPASHPALVAWVSAIARYKTLQERTRQARRDNAGADPRPVAVVSERDPELSIVLAKAVWDSLRSQDRELAVAVLTGEDTTFLSSRLHVSRQTLAVRVCRMRTRIEAAAAREELQL